ncbi:TPA: hypothetical protein ACTYQH_003653 [Klebsiella michiganensis]|uniref:hypothetical protein n=1 Tax=Klebsiella michiganensis TaxID=1134687 RepID=UPI00254E1A5C|nr:hypothetical protein [Klebsiella michiganensis]MDK9842015.1 hypothetical protein [Klebsiella michiganensis]
MLYWKKMPSLWIGNRISEFGELDTAKAIAALKIYLTFCLFSKNNESNIRTIELTFSNLCEIASLSRSLVNEGLKILYAKDLIRNISPTVRKKIYTIDVLEEHNDGWCKLPFKGVVGEDGKIGAFQSMHNRYPFELVALQVYMYLLYARDNNDDFTLARKHTICKKLKCRLPDLNKAITNLIHIGLLDKIVKKSIENRPSDLFHDSYYFYVKTGIKGALTYRVKSLANTITDGDIPF